MNAHLTQRKFKWLLHNEQLIFIDKDNNIFVNINYLLTLIEQRTE